MCLGVDLTQLDDSLGGRDKLVVRDLELLGPAPSIGVGAVFLLSSQITPQQVQGLAYTWLISLKVIQYLTLPL